MKKAEICKGGYYSDGKFGLRKVIDVGAQYKLYDGVQDQDCLRYHCLNSKSPADIGQEANSTRVSFAAWAKLEVAASQVQAHLIQQQAEKISNRLTEPQRGFLRSFDSDLKESDSVQCDRPEHRVAVACQAKGIIAKMPDRLEADERYFDVYFTPLGLAVLASVLSASN